MSARSIADKSAEKFWAAFALAIVVVSCVVVPSAEAQTTPEQRRPVIERSTTPVAGENKAAPQVVTIVHRLSGLKMFRLLLRSEEQLQSIEALDNAFNLTDEVHTNVIAGLALDDGQTIAARLPEVDAEFGPAMFPFAAPAAPLPPVAIGARPSTRANTQQTVRRVFENPDLTVIGPNGKRLAVHYVGLDGVTGLSILRLASGNLNQAMTAKIEGVSVGQSVRLLGPEPAGSTRPIVAGSLYVRVGVTPGKVFNVMLTPSGVISRFKVQSQHLLSPANVGGVAVNDDGETVGIVDSVSGSEAGILPASLIKLAAKRVLAQQSSVPQPWLGVKGEPVMALKAQDIQNLGWQTLKAASLADAQRGILLTWIAPGSPAAAADLRAGDVVLKVNDQEIQSGEDFSWVLSQTGPSRNARFTIARPDRNTPEAIDVQLSQSLDPRATLSLIERLPIVRGQSLMEHGIETIAIKRAVASRLGANAGLLIVYVEPSTPASEAGLQPGDIIQSIDGKPVVSRFMPISNAPGSGSTFAIIRKRQKLVLTVKNPEKEK